MKINKNEKNCGKDLTYLFRNGKIEMFCAKKPSTKRKENRSFENFEKNT